MKNHKIRLKMFSFIMIFVLTLTQSNVKVEAENVTLGPGQAAISITSEIEGVKVQFRDTEEYQEGVTVVYATTDLSEYVSGDGVITGLPASGDIYISIEPGTSGEAFENITTVYINGDEYAVSSLISNDDPVVYQVAVANAYDIKIYGQRHMFIATSGSWTIDDKEVVYSQGEQNAIYTWIFMSTNISLTNFDSETMEAVGVNANSGKKYYFDVDDSGNTSLATIKNRDGVNCSEEIKNTGYTNTIYFFVVKKDSGVFKNTTDSADNACGAILDGTNEELMNSLLTEEDMERYYVGANIKVYLTVEDVTETVQDTYRKKAESVKGDTTIAKYFYMELGKEYRLCEFENYNNSTAFVDWGMSLINDMEEPVAITLKVPESLLNTDPTLTREYSMIRLHEGTTLEATVIPCEYDSSDKTITFETDRFSIYALSYVDKVNSTTKEDTDTTSTTEETTENKEATIETTEASTEIDEPKDASPTTGDNNNVKLWIVFTIMSGIALLHIKRKKLLAEEADR